MTATINQSETYNCVFLMILASDHVTPATGKTVTATISKNGAAFASPAGSVSEIANGWYKLALTAADTNTRGPLAIHCTATACDATDLWMNVNTVDAKVSKLWAKVSQVL